MYRFILLCYFSLGSLCALQTSHTMVVCNTKNIKNAKNFIKSYIKNPDRNIYIIKNKQIYLTLYGTYDNKKDVYNAIKILPNKLQKENPYYLKRNYDLKVDTKYVVYKKKISSNKKINQNTSPSIISTNIKNHTMVVCNTKNITNAKQFIQKHLKNQDRTIYIVKNKKSFLTLYGTYQNKSAVYKAIKTLPQNLQNEKPYYLVRNYNLQTDEKYVVYKQDTAVDKKIVVSKIKKIKKISLEEVRTNNKRPAQKLKVNNNMPDSMYILKETEVKLNKVKHKKIIDFAKKQQKSKVVDSLSVALGQNDESGAVYRIGVQKKFATLYENSYGYLSGYYDLSFNQWNYYDSHLYGITLSPVFAYYFNPSSSKLTPYIQMGIGASYIPKINTPGKELSTRFQFEDRIGIGVQSDSFEVNLSYFHYSNAGIKRPNSGMNMFIFSLLCPIY